MLGQCDRFKVLRQAFAARLKHGHGLGAQIDDAAKGFALTHGPGHGDTGHAEFALHLVKYVQWVAHLAVHFVHKGDDRRVALPADFNQAAGLCLDAVGRVNHHQGRVHRGQHTVGVF